MGLHRLSELIKEPGVCCVCMVPCPGGVGVEGQRKADEGVEGYKLAKICASLCAVDSESLNVMAWQR